MPVERVVQRALCVPSQREPVGVFGVVQRHRHGVGLEAAVLAFRAAYDHLAVRADRTLRCRLLPRVQGLGDAPCSPQCAGQVVGLRRVLCVADADALVVRQVPQFLPLAAALLDA